MVLIMKNFKQKLELRLLDLSSQYVMDYFKKGAVIMPELPPYHSQKEDNRINPQLY